MENSSNEYHISFFKPTTPQAKANRNMVVWFVLIWFVAIFGFHFLLRIVEKPTPEPVCLTFDSVWSNVESGNATPEDLKKFGYSALTVLSKVAIAPDDKLDLSNGLSWSLYQLTTDSLRNGLIDDISAFDTLWAHAKTLTDKDFLEAKSVLAGKLSSILDVNENDVRRKILPLEVTGANIATLHDSVKTVMPGIIQKYTIHNQSFLTNTEFLGFPFHYFYTAVFLLILFVGLCWFYCIKTDKINAKFNIVD